VFGRWKRRRGGADFRNDQLRGIDAQARDFGHALHRLLMVGQELRHLLIELAEVILDQSQFFQRQLQKPAVHGIQRRARTQGVAQLRRGRA
jgi:hypothetical protein